MVTKRSFLPMCFLLVLCLSFVGCVSNILSVREFSKATINASDTFSTVADDIPKSCIRRVELVNQDNKVVVKDNNIEYAEGYLNQLSTCNKLKTSVDGIARINLVLRNYAEALGALAADNPVTFTAEVDALKKSLDSVEINGKKLDQNKVDSTSDLAAYLFSAAAEGYRQNKLKDTIKTRQKDIEQLIQSLIVTVDDYNAELDAEETQVKAIKTILIRESKKPKNERTIVDAELNGRLLDVKKHLETMETKNNAAKACIAMLRSVLDTHNKLAENIDKLKSDEMIALIQKYVEDLTPLITSVRKAYSS